MMGRQAVLGGIKVPLIYNMDPDILVPYHEKAGIHVAYMGSAKVGIAEKDSLADIENDVWASKYLSCTGEATGECKKNEYNGTCWIERDDISLADIPEQSEVPGGRASWHPGNRVHQLQGRVIAMTILLALDEALQEWSEAPGYKLDESKWHVGEMYKRQKEGMSNLPIEDSGCFEIQEKFELGYLCTVPFKVREKR